jgi:hypothetical protein
VNPKFRPPGTSINRWIRTTKKRVISQPLPRKVEGAYNGTYNFGNKCFASKRGQGRNVVAGDFDGIPHALGNGALA